VVTRRAYRRRVRDRRPLLLGAALACGLLVLLLALVLVAGPVPPAVDRWWQPVAAAAGGPISTPALTVVSRVGGGVLGVVVVPAAIAAVLLALGRRAEAVAFAVTVATSAVVVHVGKALVGRERPAGQVLETSAAFPSGHVTTAATVTVLLAVLLRRRGLLALAAVWTAGMALSRTALGVHWLTDTLAGAALGTCLALGAALVLDAVRRRRPGPRPAGSPAEAGQAR